MNRKVLDESHSYVSQIGAYSLGLQHLTGLRPTSGIIVLARRCGSPQTHSLDFDQLKRAEVSFMDRVERYFEALESPIQVSV